MRVAVALAARLGAGLSRQFGLPVAAAPRPGTNNRAGRDRRKRIRSVRPAFYLQYPDSLQIPGPATATVRSQLKERD